ncbi:MAG TPA: heme-binding protein [Steroidobacteraceae bacterium]|nr:heme-binding protein [Steroidobacteraceae bacterium]
MNFCKGCFTLITVGVMTAACSSGGPAQSSAGTSVAPAGAQCTGQCANATTFLTVADVEQIIAQGVAEATARNAEATIAVVDRVGNVLAVYRMGPASAHTVVIGTQFNAAGQALLTSGLEGIRLPSPPALASLNIDQEAAIAKAITGAYLSSEGNAFSTRTASQIIQDHFNPGVANQPSGPLFGVQFSQLACSDFLLRSSGAAAAAGPQPSPLGLAADPGGFPLYKGGTVVGGVGVLADGVYSLDKNIDDIVVGADEAIAYAATYNYAAPLDRRADQITVNGVTLRFSDVEESDLLSNPADASPASLQPAGAPASGEGFIAVPGYSDGQVHAGVAFGQPQSGIRADNGQTFPASLDAYIFVDDTNTPRFPPIAGTDGLLTQREVLQLLSSALGVVSETRAQIRVPAGLTASVTISVVDTRGVPLGMVRTRDAPIFGADVSLQKARTVVLFSSASAASFLGSLPDAQYLATPGSGAALTPVPLAQYPAALQSFLPDPTALADGVIAWSDRSIGNLSRPYFPDGIDGAPNGPLSKPAGQWSIFSDGLQLDLSINAILQHVLFVAGAAVPDVSPGCAGVALAPSLAAAQTLPAAQVPRLANGLQIFPGSEPIYRGSTLVGAIGVSGDGVDQDDMISFLGLERASVALSGSIQEAPAGRRSDTLTPKGTRLVYVQCPQSPFINSDAEDVCSGF